MEIEENLKTLNFLAMQRNGINISRVRINTPFKIEALDISIFSSRISTNTHPIIGCIVTKINDIDILKYDNKSAAKLLAYTSIISITMFSPAEYINLQRKQQRISVKASPVSSSNSNTISQSIINPTFDTTISNNVLTPLGPSTSETGLTPLTRTLNINSESEPNSAARNLNAIFQNEITQSRTSSIRSNNNQQIAVEWDYENPCFYCSCLYLKTEKNRKICCNNGLFLTSNTTYPKLNPLPPQLRFLCIERTPHFSRNSVSYNNILSLGATGVDNGTDKGGWEFRFGDSCVTLHGRTYHFLSNSTGKGGFQYFLYDAQAAMIQHGNDLNQYDPDQNNLKVYTNFLQDLFNELKNINVLVNEIEYIGNEVSNQTLLRDTPNLILNLNATTSHFDVAAISSTEFAGNRILKIRRKGSHTSTNIQVTDSKLEPLSYPLLFPYGEDGWGENIRKSLKFPVYLLSRMLMGEKNADGNFLQVRNRKGKLITVNRFQLMSRLAQTFLVDNVSRAIDFRLAWHKKHQEDIFGISQKSTSESNLGENDEINSEQSFLGQSFHGSRRHLRSLSANALAIVSEYGRPSIFITLTCNAYWDEITEMLLESQTAFDRPDIACRVFKNKLTMFLSNIRKGVYFSNIHKIIYELHVIEYQYRGLPHAHIIVQFSNMPNFEDKEALSYWIDQNICAEFPELFPNSSDEDILYFKLVEKYMIHTCSSGTPNSCLNEKGECAKKFTCNTLQAKSSFNERGFPEYKRTDPKSLKVVPHHKKVLLDWNGHANVEFAGSTFLVIYLYKYLYKGAKKAKLKLTNCDDVSNKDEIKLYLRGRYLCSMDAMWRTLGYQTYPSPNPSVRIIKIKTENEMNKIIQDGQVCDLFIYLNRPPALQNLTFTALFQNYIYNLKLPAQYRNVEINNADLSCFTVYIPHTLKTYYLYKRNHNFKSITRLEMIPLTVGEKWYLRLILYNVPVVSFKDARTVDGITFETFQEAALARKLVEDDNEARLAFQWATLDSTPAELRTLFAIMTSQGFPTVTIFNDTELRIKMMEDYLLLNDNLRLATNNLLQNLSLKLKDNDKKLSDYGLPNPQEVETELQRALLEYDPHQQTLLLQQLNSATPNTLEQQNIFNQIMDSIQNKHTSLYFIQGMGGSGKTTLAKKILAASRSQDILCLGCASTGLAATNYDNFDTAHGLFKFPITEDDEDEDEDGQYMNKLRENEERMDLLEKAQVIVWDEFPSNNKKIFEEMYRILNGFVGKVVICMGDFRQIAPVITNGTRQEIVNASIKSSLLWKRFTILHLTINMRLMQNHENIENQRRYGELLLAIGEGDISMDADLQEWDEQAGDQLYVISNLPYIHTEEEAINFIYPNGIINPDYAKERAFLAITNKDVDEWNSKIQKLNPNESVSLFSKDNLCEVDDPHGILSKMLTTEVLHQFNNNSSPPHELILKVGDICIITRNIAKKEGLANNARVMILNIQQYCIRVQTIGTIKKSFLIPRIRFKFRLPFGESFQMCRTQFPLRLAYCTSINKSQGQEYGRVLIDLRKEVFAHGHLYVALSRVKFADQITILIDEKQRRATDDIYAMLHNIIYPELLLIYST